ncbi:MAG: helix-turn-helix domain-containing protein [Egibacteraceae bacterium]
MTDGALARLRLARGWSQQELADEVAAKCGWHPSGKWCGVSDRAVRYWESGHMPTPRHVRALAAALDRSADTVLTAIEDDMRRRQLLIGAAAAGTQLGLGGVRRVEDGQGLHAEYLDLAAAYPTTSPDELFDRARVLLNKFSRALRGPMPSSGGRRQAQVDASGTASLAALVATFAGRPGEAAAYSASARSLADESGIRVVRGCALACASSLHSSVEGDGDPVAALDLLDAAAPLLGSNGLKAKWVAMRQAGERALLKREHAAFAALERADRTGEDDDGEGFVSRASLLVGSGPSWSVLTARVLTPFGRTDEALGQINTAWAATCCNVRRPAMLNADVALVHVLAAVDPEPAAAAAIRSLDLSQASGYRVGVDRLRVIRLRMPDPWADTDCVRELDARLAAA